MTRQPGTPATTAPEPGDHLADKLLAANDGELLAILTAADDADVAMHQPGALRPARRIRRAGPGTVEITLLGALGCRYGMLAGGAGGYLLRTPETTILVDPGPAAHAILASMHSRSFDWAELDAVVCTHFHPDHYAGIIPCIEGMSSYVPPGVRRLLLANPTAAARFAAFSPYHAGQMAELVTLAHPSTHGDGEPSVKIGDLSIHAVPASHVEEPAHRNSAIGLAFDTPAGGIWHTSDTTLSDELLEAVNRTLCNITMVIAHADASNIRTNPDRAAACHLQTRDVPVIAQALGPQVILIQHYDAAYSSAEYRLAQAILLQRELGFAPGGTRVIPGTGGLRFTVGYGGVVSWHLPGHPQSQAFDTYLKRLIGADWGWHDAAAVIPAFRQTGVNVRIWPRAGSEPPWSVNCSLVATEQEHASPGHRASTP